MAKITRPKGKLVRRFGINIFDTPKYDRLLERRSDPPGQHGANQARRKVSDYGQQLLEKQKLRHTYGLLEKQFHRTFQKAQRMPGVTGDNLLALLELRLDNAVFRAGFAASRSQARQMVNHGHFQVNGRKVDIPSYRLQPGDVVQVRERERSKLLATRCLEEARAFRQVSWLVVTSETLCFRVDHRPSREEIGSLVKEQLVVELYSR